MDGWEKMSFRFVVLLRVFRFHFSFWTFWDWCFLKQSQAIHELSSKKGFQNSVDTSFPFYYTHRSNFCILCINHHVVFSPNDRLCIMASTTISLPSFFSSETWNHYFNPSLNGGPHYKQKTVSKLNPTSSFDWQYMLSPSLSWFQCISLGTRVISLTKKLKN